ncbi:MAG: hypothetical protein OXU81_14755 [Gammaproteobacteria bacterium]|nr:hypothetical protein [Gammaproteobacteria bacterium]
MRDMALLLGLLREMANSPNGRIVAVATMGMSEEELKRHHHIELLVDAGHVEWNAQRSMPRITNAGYDFLNVIESDSGAHKKLVELLDKGVTYLNAVGRVIQLFGGG